MNSEKEQEYRDEARRLRLLPRQQQREIVKLIGSPARDPKVSTESRSEARRRARALSRLLGSVLEQ